jgi:transposase
LYAEPIDCRKSINSLAYCVVSVLEKEPQSGDVFIFYNRSKDKIKALYWDSNGFVLYYKRMEKRRFIISKLLKGEINLSHQECYLLFSGYDFTIRRDANDMNFSHYF